MHEGRAAPPIFADHLQNADKVWLPLVEKKGKYSFLPSIHPVTIQSS